MLNKAESFSPSVAVLFVGFLLPLLFLLGDQERLQNTRVVHRILTAKRTVDNVDVGERTRNLEEIKRLLSQHPLLREKLPQEFQPPEKTFHEDAL